MPRPFSGGDREAAVDTHQLRAGHYTRSRQYLHRIGRLPFLTNRPDRCHACERKECPGCNFPNFALIWAPQRFSHNYALNL